MTALLMVLVWRSVTHPWRVIRTPAGTVTCNGERITSTGGFGEDSFFTEDGRRSFRAVIPYSQDSSCTWRFVLRYRGWLPVPMRSVRFADRGFKRHEVSGCGSSWDGSDAALTSCTDRIVRYNEDVVISIRSYSPPCEWSFMGGIDIHEVEPVVAFGWGTRPFAQELDLRTEFRSTGPNAGTCRATNPTPALVRWLEDRLESERGQDAAASVVFHHVLARRDSSATEPEDAPHGNRVAVFSTWDDEARCIGILGFWRSQSIEAWMANDKSVYDDEAAALAMRCAAPNETSLIIASMLANNRGFSAAGSRVLVAGWADPSLHVDVELPDDQGTEESRTPPQTTGYRSSASGHFSLSVLRLPDATESITVSVGPESTFPLSLEPLVIVNPEP